LEHPEAEDVQGYAMNSQPQLLQIALDKKDVVYTPDWVARDMVEFFKPSGRILEPAAGDGAFLKYLPGADWCEIERGRDFYAVNEHYDWIFGNPPYNIYWQWFIHSLEIASNVVYLLPTGKPFISQRSMDAIREYGGIKCLRVYGGGHALNFPFGFSIAAFHFQKDYHGPMEISFYEELPQ
jgi:hypothetical protein